MEKFFWVVVEMEDGERKTVRIAGDAPGGVFQQAKAMPGVRRVGKVSPGDQSPPSQGAGSHAANHVKTSHPGQRREEQPATSQRGTAEYANSGPRVVSHARRAGGEQPFKNLYIPPERLAAPPPPKPRVERPVTVVATPPRQPAPTPAPEPVATPAPEAETKVHDYRIIKSRRQDGSPFLLQRGSWKESKGKRVFKVDWEKGFDDREKAEQHQRWVAETERELADVEQHV